VTPFQGAELMRAFVRLDADQQPASDRIKAIRAQLADYAKVVAAAKLDANDPQALYKIARVSDQLRRLDRQTAKPDITMRGADKAELQALAVGAALDRLGGNAERVTTDAESLGASVGKLSNLAFPALIGSLVALSPQLITVGLGTAGFGAAAFGLLKPLTDAASKAGGLRANLKDLNTEQRQAAQGLLSLGGEFKDFENALAPEVFQAFGSGLRIASSLMGDLLPVSRATGIAIDQLLTRVDAEFKSGTWQQFFQWMAANAGPDMKLLSDTFINLLNNLPQLVEELQPLGTAILTVTNDAARALGPLAQLVNLAERSNRAQMDSAKSTDSWAESFTNKWIPGARAVNDSISRDQEILRGWLGLSNQAGDSAAKMGNKSKDAAPKVTSLSLAVQSLAGAEGQLSAATAWANLIVTQKNDANALTTALKKSHDAVGLHTQAQRDSFSAATTYINDLLATAQAAGNNKEKQDLVRQAIENVLPKLESASGKTSAYKDEINKLITVLRTLQNMHNITKDLTLFGHGNWSITARQHALAQGPANPNGAAGLLVTGGIPGRDSVLINAMPGEVLVPTRMVKAGAVDHLRGRIPGAVWSAAIPVGRAACLAGQATTGQPRKTFLPRLWATRWKRHSWRPGAG
jgi:hypothetical protein